MTTSPSLIRSALTHQRVTLALLLIGLPLACWAWIVTMARDMYGPMTGSSAWMMTATWDTPYFLLVWAMWAAMMAAMMLPSASPFVLLYATAAARVAPPRGLRKLYALVGGYLVVWVLFSLAATALQGLLARAGLLTPMLEPATSQLAAGLLLVAGVYQWTPRKRGCLHDCRTPVSLLATERDEGASGAFALGTEHGVHCLGCCWALMLLLFAGGVMSLAVILALTALVAIEKLAPFGEQSARVSGALLVAAAVWVYVR